MLERVLLYLNNWFEVEGAAQSGTFAVEDGGLVLPFLLDGQYYRIDGSFFNNGLHRYPDTDLNTETFCGTITPLAIPPRVLALAEEIKEWETKNGETARSVLTSESFGGYSYSKSANATTGATTWESVYRRDLAPWRKL